VFDPVLELIASELKLFDAGSFDWLGGTEDDGVMGRATSFEGMEANVAWCSTLGLRIRDGTDHLASLVCWVGPKTDVPHFAVRLTRGSAAGGGGLDLYLDFLPRLDAGYDRPRDPNGVLGYAAPASREEFAQASARADYAASYFTPDALAWTASQTVDAMGGPVGTGARVGAVPSPNPEPRERVAISHHGACTGLLNGPLLLELRLPETAVGLDAARGLALEGAQRWLRWMAKARGTNQAGESQAGWLRSRMIYSRDCEVRAQAYEATARRLSKALGGGSDSEAAAKALAAADAGPLDMVGHNTLGLGREDS